MTLSQQQTVDAAAALLKTTPWRTPPLLPELVMPHGDDELAIWQAMEAAAGTPLGPPFAAMVWPGSQVLARQIFDGVIDVRGLQVFDIGSGSGAVAIAAAKCGAREVIAIDVDPVAVVVAHHMANHHQVSIEVRCADAFVLEPVVDALWLVADAIHTQAAATAALPALRRWSADGDVVVADGGRPFCQAVMVALSGIKTTTTTVPVPVGIEGVPERSVVLWQLRRLPKLPG